MPQQVPEELKQQRREELMELQQAIAEENFERAAELRDSIRNLEQEGGTHA